VPDAVRGQVIDLALERPELSPRELAVTFTDEKAQFISEASVYRLLRANGLLTSPAYIVMNSSAAFGVLEALAAPDPDARGHSGICGARTGNGRTGLRSRSIRIVCTIHSQSSLDRAPVPKRRHRCFAMEVGCIAEHRRMPPNSPEKHRHVFFFCVQSNHMILNIKPRTKTGTFYLIVGSSLAPKTCQKFLFGFAGTFFAVVYNLTS
jgi:hypothetical protein